MVGKMALGHVFLPAPTPDLQHRIIPPLLLSCISFIFYWRYIVEIDSHIK